MAYEDASEHLLMLRDARRTQLYRDAIERAVKPGDRVLDLGCGTGILSFFAARAGAARVIAVDRSPFIAVARRLATDNGFDNIDFVHGEAAALELDTRVDLIVSEWMGHFLFWEWMLPPLLQVRDKHLAPGGRMLPSRVDLHCGLVTDPTSIADLDFFRAPVYGLDFGFLADWPAHEPRARTFGPDQVHAESIALGSIDVGHCAGPPDRATGSMRTSRDLTAYGLAGWFSARLLPGDDGVLDTSPFAPPTHWRQVFFPFRKPLSVAAGEPLECSIWFQRPDANGRTLWRWRVRHGDRVEDLNSVAHATWLRGAMQGSGRT